MGKRSGLKVVGLLVLGVAVGAAISARPADAHISSRLSHLWKHIRTLCDARYYTKTESDSRFYAPGSTLPAGVTLRGIFNVGGTTPGGLTAVAYSDISFGYAFKTAPTVKYLADWQPRTTECAGTSAAPTAASGYLCLYENSHADNDWPAWDSPTPWGVRLYGYSAGPGIVGTFHAGGTWAATSN